MRRHIIYSLAAIGTAFLTVALFFLYPDIANAYRANVFIPVSAWIRRIMQPIRLSLAEILLAAAGVCAVMFFARLCTGNKSMRLGRMLSVFSTGLLLYVYLWGALYMCPPAFKAAENVSAEGVLKLCGTLIDSLNGLSGSFVWPDMEEVCVESARLMSKGMGISLSEPKIVRWSGLFERMSIAGMYFPLTFEALVSPEDIRQMIPFTACHELAHQAGLAREDEASFAAWLICQDGIAAFRYSADLSMLISGMKMLRLMDAELWNNCVQRMNKEVLFDFRCANGLYEASAGRRKDDIAVGSFGSPSEPDIYDRAAVYALEYIEEYGRRQGNRSISR